MKKLKSGTSLPRGRMLKKHGTWCNWHMQCHSASGACRVLQPGCDATIWHGHEKKKYHMGALSAIVTNYSLAILISTNRAKATRCVDRKEINSRVGEANRSCARPIIKKNWTTETRL